jgi:hypothetical protein
VAAGGTSATVGSTLGSGAEEVMVVVSASGTVGSLEFMVLNVREGYCTSRGLVGNEGGTG